MCLYRRSRWPRGLRRGFAAAGRLGLRVRIPSGTWISVCCDCCVLSGIGLCDGPITHSEEFYQVWCVWVWSRNLNNEEASAYEGCRATEKKKYFCIFECKSNVVWEDSWRFFEPSIPWGLISSRTWPFLLGRVVSSVSKEAEYVTLLRNLRTTQIMTQRYMPEEMTKYRQHICQNHIIYIYITT